MDGDETSRLNVTPRHCVLSEHGTQDWITSCDDWRSVVTRQTTNDSSQTSTRRHHSLSLHHDGVHISWHNHTVLQYTSYSTNSQITSASARSISRPCWCPKFSHRWGYPLKIGEDLSEVRPNRHAKFHADR